MLGVCNKQPTHPQPCPSLDLSHIITSAGSATPRADHPSPHFLRLTCLVCLVHVHAKSQLICARIKRFGLKGKGTAENQQQGEGGYIYTTLGRSEMGGGVGGGWGRVCAKRRARGGGEAETEQRADGE